MATRAVLVDKPAKGIVRAKWLAIASTDDGAACDAVGFTDKCVQVLGTFGGGTILIEGSNDGGATWAGLHFADGTAASFTAAGINALLESPMKIRPRASVAVTTIEVWVVGKGL